MNISQDLRVSPGRSTRSKSTRPALPPANPEGHISGRLAPLNAVGNKVLIIDLNNFSTFPTLAVGILVASLRNAGYEVDVLCPLAHDVPAAEREKREGIRDHLARRIHLSTSPTFRQLRDAARRMRFWWRNQPHPRVLREARSALDAKPDILLLSAYLQHYRTVIELGKLAKARNVPFLLGGPVFNFAGTADAWRDIPGLTAIVGSEVDLSLPKLVEATCRNDNLLAFDGVVLPDGRKSRPAPPLRALDRVPVPDFTDFPWDRYRFRIIPLMAARGCQWARCLFCSDVASTSGRTFRSRDIESVMHEMREQAFRHRTNNFLFLDLKLNSDPDLFRGIIENVQHHVYGAQWIGTVHVDLRKDNGLSRCDLRAAVRAGMRRVSFGLETGSQRLLDAMAKGSSVESNSDFIRNAHEAGLSVRCTMFKGFPGETSEDLEQTAQFLEEHAPYLDRVRYNEFSVPENTPIYEAIADSPSRYPQLTITKLDYRQGRAQYVNAETGSIAYRKAKARVLRAVYAINRRKLRSAARAFDGLM